MTGRFSFASDDGRYWWEAPEPLEPGTPEPQPLSPQWQPLGYVDETEPPAEVMQAYRGRPSWATAETGELPRVVVAPEEQAAAYGPGGCAAAWVPLSVGGAVVLAILVYFGGWLLGLWSL